MSGRAWTVAAVLATTMAPAFGETLPGVSDGYFIRHVQFNLTASVAPLQVDFHSYEYFEMRSAMVECRVPGTVTVSPFAIKLLPNGYQQAAIPMVMEVIGRDNINTLLVGYRATYVRMYEKLGHDIAIQALPGPGSGSCELTVTGRLGNSP